MKNKCWNDNQKTTTNTNHKRNDTVTNGRWVPSAHPVHFWSVGEERWLSSNFFPPLDVQDVNLMMLGNNRDSNNRQQPQEIKSIKKKNDDLFSAQQQQQHPSRTCLVKTPVSNSYELQIVMMNETSLLSSVSSTSSLSSSSSVMLNQTPIRYEVDYEATTYGLSRWIIGKHPFRMATSFHIDDVLSPSEQEFKSIKSLLFDVFYNFLPWPKRAACIRHNQRLLFTTPMLTTSLRIIGSPLLKFSLNLTAEFERRSEALHRDIVDGHSLLRVNRQNPVSALGAPPKRI